MASKLALGVQSSPVSMGTRILFTNGDREHTGFLRHIDFTECITEIEMNDQDENGEERNGGLFQFVMQECDRQRVSFMTLLQSSY